MEAVSVRSTRGPNVMGNAPADRIAPNSPGLKSPSGPTQTEMDSGTWPRSRWQARKYWRGWRASCSSPTSLPLQLFSPASLNELWGYSAWECIGIWDLEFGIFRLNSFNLFNSFNSFNSFNPFNGVGRLHYVTLKLFFLQWINLN